MKADLVSGPHRNYKVSAGYLFAGNLLVIKNLENFWWIPVKGVSDTVSFYSILVKPPYFQRHHHEKDVKRGPQ